MKREYVYWRARAIGTLHTMSSSVCFTLHTMSSSVCTLYYLICFNPHAKPMLSLFYSPYCVQLVCFTLHTMSSSVCLTLHSMSISVSILHPAQSIVPFYTAHQVQLSLFYPLLHATCISVCFAYICLLTLFIYQHCFMLWRKWQPKVLPKRKQKISQILLRTSCRRVLVD